MSLMVILLLAVGLSMDTFSLSLIYGTLNLNKNKQLIMSIIVGIFHFFMPILGYKLGKLLLSIIKLNPKMVVGIIFIIIGIEMLLSIKKEEKVIVLTGILSIIFFAFTVSIDSFSTGITFSITDTKLLLPCIIFSIISGLFTYFGVFLGKKIQEVLGNISIIIGAIILIIIGITYLK